MMVSLLQELQQNETCMCIHQQLFAVQKRKNKLRGKDAGPATRNRTPSVPGYSVCSYDASPELPGNRMEWNESNPVVFSHFV